MVTGKDGFYRSGRRMSKEQALICEGVVHEFITSGSSVVADSPLTIARVRSLKRKRDEETTLERRTALGQRPLHNRRSSWRWFQHIRTNGWQIASMWAVSLKLNLVLRECIWHRHAKDVLESPQSVQMATHWAQCALCHLGDLVTKCPWPSLLSAIRPPVRLRSVGIHCGSMICIDLYHVYHVQSTTHDSLLEYFTNEKNARVKCLHHSIQ